MSELVSFASSNCCFLNGANLGIGLSNPSHPLHISTGASSNALVVTSGGNVGVGTAVPLAALHVNGSTTASSFVSTSPYVTTSVADQGTLDVSGSAIGLASTGSWALSTWRTDAPAFGNTANVYYYAGMDAIKALASPGGAEVSLAISGSNLRIANGTGAAGTFTVVSTKLAGP